MPPLKVAIDLDSEGRRMPTLFTTPALIVRKAFHDLLVRAGATNLEPCSVVIENAESPETSSDYVVLNILGKVAAADLSASAGFLLGPDIRVLDHPVLRRDAIGAMPIFRLAEDPIQIIVADSVADAIRLSGLDDVHLDELATT